MDRKIKEKEMAERIFLNNLSDCEKFPKYFMIETSNKCNARCPMCPVSVRKEEASQNERFGMDSSMFEHILEEIRPYTDWIEMVQLFWIGEPLLDKELETRVKKLKDMGIKCVSVSTNGALLDDNRCSSLLLAGIDSIRFSIDSVCKETYEELRKGLHYETVIKNTIRAIELRNELSPKTEIRIRMIDLKETHNEIETWKRFWKQYLREGDIISVMPQINTWNFRGEKLEQDILDPCIALFSTIVINHAGKVALCCTDSEIVEELGDLNKNTIKEIWNGDKIKKYRELHLSNNRNDINICRGCNAWTVSRGNIVL